MATYTQEDLANIKAAIAGGVKQAMIAGEMVQYRDLGEMLQIKRLIEADLMPPRAAVPLVYPSTSRGV